MGWSKKPKPPDFKHAVKRAAETLELAGDRAVTPEETMAVAQGWTALVEQLNPANVFDPDKKDKKDKKDD